MSNGNNQLVVDFLMSRVNPFYLGAYNTLSSLKYPIPDHLSFVQQLEQMTEKKDKKLHAGETQRAEKIIRLVLGARDFPISTPQSALEKFHEGLFTLIEPRGPIPNPRDELDVPSDNNLAPPPPDEIYAVCRKTADKARQTFINNNPNASTKDIHWAWILALLECLSEQRKWATVSLPFAKGGYRPEAFFGRS